MVFNIYDHRFPFSAAQTGAVPAHPPAIAVRNGPRPLAHCGHAGDLGPAAAAAVAAAGPARLVRRRAGRPARGHAAHGPALRRAAARARVPGARHIRRGRRIPPRRGCRAAPAAARRRGGGGRRDRPAHGGRRLRRRVAALQSVTVPLAAGTPTVDPAALTAVATACRDHQRLRFDYRSGDGTSSVRTAEPHRLVHTGRRWYLLAWDVDRQDWRTFRMDRLAPRIPTGPRFTPRELPDSDAAAYTSWSVSTAVYRYHGRFTIHAPAGTVAERVSPSSGVVEAIDEHTCTLHAGANSLDSMVIHVALIGFDFEVHEPPELVARVREIAHRLARAAGPDPG